ncbi:FtsX-like permease family protein [Helcococcus kunzii]|uniref:FtsX-like permease family protein n=1 Tax=Helcococcus kunzii TaxID=40091 RepID=UPI00389EE0E2
MNFILQEIRDNFPKLKYLIITLIISITICFMIIFSTNKLYNNREEDFNKTSTAEYKISTEGLNKLNLIQKYKLNFMNLYFYPPGDLGRKIDNLISSSGYLFTNDFFVPDDKSTRPSYTGKVPKFSDKEMEIAIPKEYSYIKNIKINDNFEVNGENLKVVGFTDSHHNNSFIISLETAKKLNLSINKLWVNLNDDYTLSERKDIYDNVSNILNTNYKIINFKGYNDPILGSIEMQTSIIGLAVLNITLIYWYVLESRKKRYFIYRFSGMNEKYFYKMITFEIFIIYLVSFFIALSIFILIKFLVLKTILNIDWYDISLSTILLVFVLFLLILVIATILNARKYFKNSLMESYKG